MGCEGASLQSLTGIICQLTGLVSAVVPVLVALALLYFLWGLAQWILNIADTDKHKEGKQRMVWGLVALFVIMSVGGLILVLQATFFGGGTGLHDPLLSGNNYLGPAGANPPIESAGSGTALPSGGHVAPDGSANEGGFRLVGPGNPAVYEEGIRSDSYFNFCFLGFGNRCPARF